MTVWGAFDLIVDEYYQSVDKHGDWNDYSVDQMMSVIINELMVEAGGAEAAGDFYGEHGVIRELSQVAACCLKAILVLSNHPDRTLAPSNCAAVARSLAGQVAPAAPSLDQITAGSTNCPSGAGI